MFATSFAAIRLARARRVHCARCANSQPRFCSQWPGSRAIRVRSRRRATKAGSRCFAPRGPWGPPATRFSLEERVSTHVAKPSKCLKPRFPLYGPPADAKKHPLPHCGIDPRRFVMIKSCSSLRASLRISTQTETGRRALVFCAVRRTHASNVTRSGVTSTN